MFCSFQSISLAFILLNVVLIILFDTIVNGIVFLVSSSDHSLLGISFVGLHEIGSSECC